MSGGAGIGGTRSRAGGTWSRGPVFGDATVEPAVGASCTGPSRAAGGRIPKGPSSAPRRAPLAGCDRGADQGASSAVADPRASQGCGRFPAGGAWGEVAAWRPVGTVSFAAFRAPSRTTLRETESGAHPKGSLFRPSTRPLGTRPVKDAEPPTRVSHNFGSRTEAAA